MNQSENSTTSSSTALPFATSVPEESERVQRMQDAGVPEQYWKWMGPHGVAPMTQKLGLVYREMSPEKIVATLPVAGNEQNMGLLHGGAHLAVAETLGSIASILHVRVNLEADNAVVGTELNATHHRSLREGVVVATCTPLNLGRTLAVHDIVMRDEQGRRLSTARMTNLVLAQR